MILQCQTTAGGAGRNWQIEGGGRWVNFCQVWTEVSSIFRQGGSAGFTDIKR